MKHILMIGTGGTIASEMSPDGLTPEISSEQLLAAVPRIGELCEVDCLQLLQSRQHEPPPRALAGTRPRHPRAL